MRTRLTRENILRRVCFRPYAPGQGQPNFTLLTWDTGGHDEQGRWIIGYLLKQGSRRLFEGTQRVPRCECIDSDNTIRAIMTFLTLRERDVEADSFDDYTPRQLAFRDEHAESLGNYVLEWFESRRGRVEE